MADSTDESGTEWELVENAEGYYYIRNVETGYNLRPTDSSNGNFLYMAPNNWLWHWTQWSMEDLGSSIRFINRKTGMYFRPNGGNNETIQAVNTSYQGNWPRWVLEEVDNSGGSDWWQPAPGTTWQWQLQGTINTSYDVDMYDIDLWDTSASQIASLQSSGKKVICYFSGGSYENWRDDAGDFNSSDLGSPLGDWEGENWLNISSSNVRSIMEARLDLAVSKGCDGVEPDNMDGYANSNGLGLTSADQIDYNIFIAEAAHDRGLSVGLKNDLEDNHPTILEPYFDFAVNEECFEWNECSSLEVFIDAGKAVFSAEYTDSYSEAINKADDICAESVSSGLSTLILPLELDDAFRYSCL